MQKWHSLIIFVLCSCGVQTRVHNDGVLNRACKDKNKVEFISYPTTPKPFQMDLSGLRYDHLKLGVHQGGATHPYLEKEKSDSKTDFRFVFSDPENLGYTTVSKIDSNFRYYGHPKFEISRHRLLINISLSLSLSIR